MGFFFGFLFGIAAGITFSENNLSFPLNYIPKQNGFGKLEVNLEVLDPLYKSITSVTGYFKSAKG